MALRIIAAAQELNAGSDRRGSGWGKNSGLNMVMGFFRISY
ncbi:hypothetical protein [Pantoea sp. R13S299]